MDEVQKSICKDLGADDDYQSVLNVQKRRGAPYREVKNKPIERHHDGSGNWLLTFCSNEMVQICNSSKTSISWVNRNCIHASYRSCAKKFLVSFLLVQKQTDGYNCDPFAIAFIAEILDGKSAMEARFNVERM